MAAVFLRAVTVLILLLASQAITGKPAASIALLTSASTGADWGLATSPDGEHMVVSHGDGALSVYSLRGGNFIRRLDSDSFRVQFNYPGKVCFSANGNILVAEYSSKRVQEVTLTGSHVRFIGVGVIDDKIWAIAANAELIVVGKYGGTSTRRIMMFHAVSGAFVRAFGYPGESPGQVMVNCWGIRFMPDGRHIVVAESNGALVFGVQGRLSVFTVAGEFVRCMGKAELWTAHDVEVADNGDIVVCDSRMDRFSVYTANTDTLLRQWRDKGDAASASASASASEKLQSPTALAMCGGQLYVLDERSRRVQVFE